MKLIGSNDLLRLTNNAADEGSPAWSPDGKRIAFARSLENGKCAVVITSPLGGSERKLTEISTPYLSPRVSPEDHSLLAWAPDGRYLAVADTAPANGLYLISVDTAERKTLIHDTGVIADVDPAFSPGGDRIAYVRMITVFSSRALWMPLGPGYQPAGPATEIPTPATVNASPLWIGSGQILLSSGAPGGMRLYRTTPGAGGVPIPATNVVTNAGLALNAKTGRLIFTSRELIQNLFQISVSGTGISSQAPERLTSTTGNDFLPRYSPDGKSVAFASLRFGESGVWTIQTQGTLSAELVSSPQGTLALGDWAPDGKSLVFFSTMSQGRWQLYRVAVDTGKVTRLTDGSADDIFPTWSRTGKWIYFSSTRGGDITRLVDRIHNGSGYVATTGGAYYWGGNASRAELRYVDPQTRRDELVFQPQLRAATNLTMSPDGRRLCFPLVERNSQELMMIENWR